jgi:hypothetical protein
MYVYHLFISDDIHVKKEKDHTCVISRGDQNGQGLSRRSKKAERLLNGGISR